MANKNRTGFYPVGTLTGAPWHGGVRRFIANTTSANLCIGDLVTLDVLGKAQLVPTIAAGVASNIVGAIVGIEPVAKTTNTVQAGSLTLERIYIPSATAGTVYVRVATDPKTIYECVSNGAVSYANIGQCFSITGTAGGQQSPATKPMGAAVIDIQTGGKTANCFICVDIPNYPDNDMASANARMHVVLNGGQLGAASHAIG